MYTNRLTDNNAYLGAIKEEMGGNTRTTNWNGWQEVNHNKEANEEKRDEKEEQEKEI